MKDVIDYSINSDLESNLETESNELNFFFIIMENIFNHGLKCMIKILFALFQLFLLIIILVRKAFGVSVQKIDLLVVLDLAATKCSQLSDTLKSVKDMSEIRLINLFLENVSSK